MSGEVIKLDNLVSYRLVDFSSNIFCNAFTGFSSAACVFLVEFSRSRSFNGGFPSFSAYLTAIKNGNLKMFIASFYSPSLSFSFWRKFVEISWKICLFCCRNRHQTIEKSWKTCQWWPFFCFCCPTPSNNYLNVNKRYLKCRRVFFGFDWDYFVKLRLIDVDRIESMNFDERRWTEWIADWFNLITIYSWIAGKKMKIHKFS